MRPHKQKRAAPFIASPTQPAAFKTTATAEAWGKKRHFCKPLPTQFRRYGFTYRQIAREGSAAIYEQTWKGSKNSAAFEVIRIRQREGFEISGRFVEPAEVYPNSQAWGTDGWTVTNKEAAFRKLREVVNSQDSGRPRGTVAPESTT